MINYLEQNGYVEYGLSLRDYFNKECIELDVLEALCQNYCVPTTISLKILPKVYDCNPYYLYFSGSVWIASDDETKLKEIRDILEKKFNDAIKEKEFGLLLGYYTEINKRHNQLKEELTKILIDVTINGNPLKGNCGEQDCG